MNPTKIPLLRDKRLHFVIVGLFLCLIPLFASMKMIPTALVTLLGGVLVYAVAGLGLDLLMGYAGLISLGTAGFMGLAAYLAAYFTEDLNLPFVVSLVLAVFIPVLFGLVVGLASLRIEGIYLAIATLCFAEILRKSFEELEWLTGGFGGKKASYPSFFGVTLNRNGAFVVLVVVLVLAMVFYYHLVNSRPGRALEAMRGSEVAAEAMGVSLLKYRLLAFALATGFGALSGVLYVHFVKFSYPEIWTIGMSLNILAVVIIGGLRSPYGPLVGAFVVYAVPELFLKKLPVIGTMNGLAFVFNGVLIILIVLFYPKGLVHIGRDIQKLFKGRGKGNGGSSVRNS